MIEVLPCFLRFLGGDVEGGLAVQLCRPGVRAGLQQCVERVRVTVLGGNVHRKHPLAVGLVDVSAVFEEEIFRTSRSFFTGLHQRGSDDKRATKG